MGQGEIFQFLIENEGQIFTAKEICTALDRATASSALLRLRKYPPEGFNFSKFTIKAETYIYWYKKKGSRLYQPHNEHSNYQKNREQKSTLK